MQRSRWRSWSWARGSSAAGVTADEAGTVPCSAPMTATAWELQALHAVHGAGPDRAPGAVGAEGEGRDAGGLEGLARRLDHAAGPGGHADGVRFDAGIQPAADPLHEGVEFVLAGGGAGNVGAVAVHGGAVAEQTVGLPVQAGDRCGPEQRDRPGEDLRGGPVVHRQPPAAAPDADTQAGQGHVIVVDPLVRVGGDEQVIRPGRDSRLQQAPLGGVQVLAFVHDDMPVQGDTGFAEQVGRLVGELEVG